MNSPGETAAVAKKPVPSFVNQVLPALTKLGCNSGACHGAALGKGGFRLSLRGYDPEADHLEITRHALGRRLELGNPGRSLLLLKPTGGVPHGGGLRLNRASAEYRLLEAWVAAGAPGPTSADARIVRLETLPPAPVLQPGDEVQVKVRASYSDGHTADVTHWAKYTSTDEMVAGVSDTGRVRVAGPGQAAITVWFSSLVATVRVVVPYSHTLDPQAFSREERHNFIDDHVLAKLEALHIPPSPLCSDREFIRRAFLDAAGILPAPEEVDAFVADPRADKRARLIDALLERPEFIDYWTYKWSDLLLVSSRKMPESATWAYYQYIRQSVATNKPWDQLAREVLTATGSNLRNGAVNYYLRHKDFITELTETTTQTFLGVSVTCCRCHNHPLEKWTLNDYWSLANLFSRVALKHADQPLMIRKGKAEGEVSLQTLPLGDVLHPRKGVALPPAPLGGMPLPPGATGDRRQHFVAWLLAPDNPYFARALVNRVWKNFFRRGLVEAEDDLRDTNPPTNEELLAALAKDFVAHGYDVRHLIRTVMNSATYQRSSEPLPENAEDDRFYSHYLVRRLMAEVILDAYSQITGVPTPFPGYPEGTRALQLPDSMVPSAFLTTFGRPTRDQSCTCERQQDSRVGQALDLSNGKTLNNKLRADGARVAAWEQEGIGDEEAVRRLYRLALCREPEPAELENLTHLMAQAPGASRREILEDLFWAVLTRKEFLFNR